MEGISARAVLGYETFQGTWGWVLNEKKGCPMGRALWDKTQSALYRHIQPPDLFSFPSLLRAGAAPVLVPSTGQHGWSQQQSTNGCLGQR